MAVRSLLAMDEEPSAAAAYCLESGMAQRLQAAAAGRWREDGQGTCGGCSAKAGRARHDPWTIKRMEDGLAQTLKPSR